MKLRKEICKRCFWENGLLWTEWSEEYWKDGRAGDLFCGRRRENGDWDAPKDCSYKFEHLVMGNQDEDETQ